MPFTNNISFRFLEKFVHGNAKPYISFCVCGKGWGARGLGVFIFISMIVIQIFRTNKSTFAFVCQHECSKQECIHLNFFFFNYRLFCVWVYITQNFHFCRTWSERAQATAVSVSLPSCISFCFSPFLHFLHWPGSLRFYFPVFTVFTINSVFRVQETDSFSLLWQCGVNPFCRV